MSGVPESDTPFIDDDRAHAPNASAPRANDTYKAFDFIGGLEEREEGRTCQSARVVAQHQAHACDLRRLVGVDIRREAEDVQLLAGARAREELVHHRQGASVVL